MAIHMKTEDRAKPRPQIRGSARGSLGLRNRLEKLPKGTPMMPESMVTTPKAKAIFSGFIGLAASSMFIDLIEFSRKFGAHQVNAPVQKVTQVNPRVERRKDLLASRLFKSSPYEEAFN